MCDINSLLSEMRTHIDCQVARSSMYRNGFSSWDELRQEARISVWNTAVKYGDTSDSVTMRKLCNRAIRNRFMDMDRKARIKDRKLKVVKQTLEDLQYDDEVLRDKRLFYIIWQCKKALGLLKGTIRKD